MSRRPRKSSGRIASKGHPNTFDVRVERCGRVEPAGDQADLTSAAPGLRFRRVQKTKWPKIPLVRTKLANALDVSVPDLFRRHIRGPREQDTSDA